MLDRVDAGADRGVDALRAMGVGGDAQCPMMRLVGDRAELLSGTCSCPGSVLREKTPPVAQTLITSAPNLRCRRTW